MINTVIFDLDGLLVDSETSFLEMYNILLGNYGHSLSKEEYINTYCGKTLVENMEKMASRYNLPMSGKQAYEYILNLEEERIRKGYPLKEGGKELLDYLKNNDYKIVLATSSIYNRALTLLKNNGVDTLFDSFICKEDVSKGKPDPEVFIKAAESVSSTRDDCLILEDSQLGVEAARNAGIKVICVPDLIKPDEKHKMMAEKVYASLYDVIDYLKKTNKKV